MIREAERAKANIFPQQGNELLNSISNQASRAIAQIDEEYMVIGGHMDETAQAKISQGEYVDFTKLLPRDRIVVEEDDRMELTLRDGRAYWTPMGNLESTVINNFSKWEQAFRIFSNIYTRAHPHRAAELIQYNHVIYSIAMSFTWDNMHAYDCKFHMHISKHPLRSWAVILQQAWSMRLKDRLRSKAFAFSKQGKSNSSSKPGRSNQGGSAEPCRCFNHGRCNFGTTCKYEHHCTYCGKFCHGFLVCRKASADRGKQHTSDKRENKDYMEPESKK